MKFFKPEDFDSWSSADPRINITGLMASIANAKLEREGKIVEGNESFGEWHLKSNSCHVGKIVTQKALLIGIEKIEPEHKHVWICACGEKHD